MQEKLSAIEFKPNKVEQSRNYRLGLVGEQIVRHFLTNCKVEVARADKTAPFDMVIFKDKAHKEFAELVEVKTRYCFLHTKGSVPGFTLFTHEINNYLRVETVYQTPMRFFFVEWREGVVYSQRLRTMIQPIQVKSILYPVELERRSDESKFCVFPLESFEKAFSLSDSEKSLFAEFLIESDTKDNLFYN